jgi:hypothetical protein
MNCRVPFPKSELVRWNLCLGGGGGGGGIALFSLDRSSFSRILDMTGKRLIGL